MILSVLCNLFKSIGGWQNLNQSKLTYSSLTSKWNITGKDSNQFQLRDIYFKFTSFPSSFVVFSILFLLKPIFFKWIRLPIVSGITEISFSSSFKTTKLYNLQIISKWAVFKQFLVKFRTSNFKENSIHSEILTILLFERSQFSHFLIL